MLQKTRTHILTLTMKCTVLESIIYFNLLYFREALHKITTNLNKNPYTNIDNEAYEIIRRITKARNFHVFNLLLECMFYRDKLNVRQETFLIFSQGTMQSIDCERERKALQKAVMNIDFEI